METPGGPLMVTGYVLVDYDGNPTGDIFGRRLEALAIARAQGLGVIEVQVSPTFVREALHRMGVGD